MTLVLSLNGYSGAALSSFANGQAVFSIEIHHVFVNNLGLRNTPGSNTWYEFVCSDLQPLVMEVPSLVCVLRGSQTLGMNAEHAVKCFAESQA